METNDQAPAEESRETSAQAAPSPLEQAIPVAESVRKAPAEWAKDKGTPAWQYAGAHAGHRWAVFNLPITETEYDEAIAKAAGVVCR